MPTEYATTSVLTRPRSNTSDPHASERSYKVQTPAASAEEVLNAAFHYAASNQGSQPTSRKSSQASVPEHSYPKSSAHTIEDVQPALVTLSDAPESRKISIDQSNVTVSETASSAENAGLNELIAQIFQAIDTNNTGSITVEEAEKTLLRLNTRLSKNYGESDIKSFFEFLDVNQTGTLSFDEFRRAFLNIAQ